MRKIIKIFISLALCCFFNNADAVENKTVTLSLDDAILLALRSNPNVQTGQLSLVLQKFALYVQQWQFYPHFSLSVSGTAGRGFTDGEETLKSKGFVVSPSMTWNSTIGTTVTVNATNQSIGQFYNPGLSLSVTQPLMRGFGKPIVEQALDNARDSELISRMNMEGTLRGTVSSVVNAYLDVMTAERRVEIDEEALKRAQSSVEQTKKFIKAGHKAGNELVTVEANVATAQSNLANDKNSLQQSRYALLSAIGIDPNSDLAFSNLDLDTLIKKYHLPTLNETRDLVLSNDISYQTDQILLHGEKRRTLLTAEDNTRWKLDLTANASTGNNNGAAGAAWAGEAGSGLSGLFDGANQAQSVNLTLTIPIDDEPAKQALEGAKIALKEAEIALQKEKWEKETSAINGWNSVSSAKGALAFAESAQKLQQKTYDISYQKYLYGLIDSLELQSAQLSLIQSEQSLLSARIAYIKSLVNLDLLTGNTLKTWDVKTRVK